MGYSDFKARIMAGERMIGTFMKTPAHEVVEVLAKSGLDFLILDAEHAGFDRRSLDVCLAVGRAMDFPLLVRVPDGTPSELLKALDAGAVGVVVPHVDSVEKAQMLGKAGHFGHGGRGYAGSTRWAGFATRPMADILEQSGRETIIIAQIEEPEGVDNIEGIAAADGIDGIFVGPADLSVAFGKTDTSSQELIDSMTKVGAVTKKEGLAYMTFVPNAEAGRDWDQYGFNAYAVASEHTWMLQGAKAVVKGLKE